MTRAELDAFFDETYAYIDATRSLYSSALLNGTNDELAMYKRMLATASDELNYVCLTYGF